MYPEYLLFSPRGQIRSTSYSLRSTSKVEGRVDVDLHCVDGSVAPSTCTCNLTNSRTLTCLPPFSLSYSLSNPNPRLSFVSTLTTVPLHVSNA